MLAKKSLLSAVLMLLFTSAFAQKNSFVFEKDSINVGRIETPDTVIIAKYSFKRVKNNNQVIKKVDTDCACAVVEYPKGTLLEGEENFIVVKLEPYKPGYFNKKTKVIFGPVKDTITLDLTGYVEPYSVDPEVEFARTIGPLKLQSKIIALGHVTDTSIVRKELEFYNASNKEVILLDTMLAPEHLFVVMDSAVVIPPKQKASLYMYYNAEAKYHLGFSHDNLTMYAKYQGDSVEILHMPITSFISHQIRHADRSAQNPRLVVNKEKAYLGKLPTDEGGEAVFKISNSGQAPLQILDVGLASGCELQALEKDVLQPGESVELTIRVNFLIKKGYQLRKIYLFTNDPDNSTKELSMSVRFY